MIKDKKVYYAGANGLEIFAIEGLRDLYIYNCITHDFNIYIVKILKII